MQNRWGHSREEFRNILAATRQAGLLKGQLLWLGAGDTDISKKQSVSIGINNRGKVRIAARWGTCVTEAMVPPWAGKLEGKCSVLRGPTVNGGWGG